MRRTICAFLAVMAATSVAAQNLVTNSHFDANISGWNPHSTTWDALDAQGSPSSGSARTAANWYIPGTAAVFSLGLYQCVPVKPNTSYRGSGNLMIQSYQAGSGEAAAVLEFYNAPGCFGFISAASGPYADSTSSAGWVTSATTAFSPNNAISGLVAVNVGVRTVSPLLVNSDDLVLQQTSTLPPTDLNNDGNSDVIWRNSASGADMLWFMKGMSVQSAGLPTVADPDFHVAGTGDFGGGGGSSLVWRNDTTGANVIWFMNGATIAFSTTSTVAPPWTIAGVGDVNGDGKADIIWRNTSTGDNVVWLMNGGLPSSTPALPPIPDQNWKLAAIGDFQGDGRMDLVWRNTATGDNAVWLMNGGTVAASASLPSLPDLNWTIVGAGDFQGDGKADLLWRNTSTGANVIWFMDGTSVALSALLPTVAPPWVAARVGDFQDDGKADILWRNTATGDNAIWLMNGSTVAASGSLPSVSDTTWDIVRH